MDSSNKAARFSLGESLVVMLAMFTILGVMIIKFDMSPQIPILFVFTLVLFYGHFKKFSWDEIFDGVSEGVTPGIIPILIFLMIGILVASWLKAGTIAGMMFIGLKLISVQLFLPTVFIICAIIGITVGSSFTTVSTIGIAFMGIGHVLGFAAPVIAGAVVSGAFLGNNMSPLSDTSNLTTGIAKVNLYTHLKNMSLTVIPAAIIALGAFTAIGLHSAKNADLSAVKAISAQLMATYHISILTFLPVFVLLILAWRKVPAIPTLLLGSLTAIVLSMVQDRSFTFGQIGDLLMNGNHVASTNTVINRLMSGGGITNMLSSVALIILALSLGGLLIKFGIIEVLINSMSRLISTPGRLILATLTGSLAVNLLVGEQYLSIILPGETFKKSYDDLQVDKKYLSRTLATGGADINALVPWGVSGIFCSATLGVSAFQYIGYAFYPYLNPLMTIILGFTVVTWTTKRFKKRHTGANGETKADFS
ncbi:Na+/H+ antiporter NhaC [Secundilactobacillus yichangensis]|uniref:Na+/H+ antiporter NhaC n=1 Tax=Secundilactobacillus yichangensis TaxID=2799580 RepID=UPI001940EEF1|nr:Na+/H+ antiporter NhaC [Secundilactobacillus yichangensis]